MKLEKKLSLAILMLIFMTIIIMQFIFFKSAYRMLEANKKNSLSGYAYAISKDHIIIDNLSKGRYLKLQKKLDSEWEKFTKLNYIVITDKYGKIIVYKSRNGSSNLNLEKKEIIDVATEHIKNGTPKYFVLDKKTELLEIFVPIMENGKYIGMLGIQEHYVENNSLKKIIFIEFFLAIAIVLILSFIISIYLAKNIKSQIFGYEPIEIANFYKERQLIFDAISDEIITLDSSGKISKMNKAAEKNLTKEDEVLLKKLYDEILATGNVFSSREYKLSNETVYITSLIVNREEDKFNVLFIITSGKKVKKLAEDITGVTQIINSMRANVHEFKNKIHVIAGLLRLEEYEAAKKYISNIKVELDHENKIVEGVNDSIIKALLLTKINLAKEKKIKLTIEEDSNLMTSHKNISTDDLIVVIGNLIENAMESFDLNSENKIISSYFLEDNNKIYIEVRDNGKPIENIENIFKMGISSKGKGRGSGLALIKNIVQVYNGKVNINLEGEFKIFSIELFKEELNG